MSLSLWAVFIIIGVICAFIFKKTVSNDAKNDYRIRDILANSSNEDSEYSFEPKQKVKNPQTISEEKNIYEEIAKKQQENNAESNSVYSTTTHEEPKTEYYQEGNKYEQEVFYEKINDDACPYDKEDDDYYEDEDDLDSVKPNKTIKKSRTLFDYVKTFWRGITFTIGLLICIYSFIGVTTQVQTSNDAIVYSIWLLIGVILIK